MVFLLSELWTNIEPAEVSMLLWEAGVGLTERISIHVDIRSRAKTIEGEAIARAATKTKEPRDRICCIPWLRSCGKERYLPFRRWARVALCGASGRDVKVRWSLHCQKV